MAARMRNNPWKDDACLKAALIEYVRQNLPRKELLDFVKLEFAQYTWSLPTLDRRLRHFDIHHVDKNLTAEDV